MDQLLKDKDAEIAALKGQVDHYKTERDNWEESTLREMRNTEFYRNLVVKIGELFPKESRICDDGSMSEDVLCAKVPEVIQATIQRQREAIEVMANALSAVAMDYEDSADWKDAYGRLHKLADAALESAKEFI